MQAHPEDRISRNRPHAVLPWILVFACLSAAGWYWQHTQNSPATTSEASAVPKVIQPVVMPLPTAEPVVISPDLIPAQPEPPVPAEQVAASLPPALPAPATTPLPELDQSDDAIKLEVSQLAGPASQDTLSTHWHGDNLLRRFVAFAANLAEGKLDSKSSPLTPPKGRFAVAGEGPLYMTPESQARFYPLIQLLTHIDPASCAATYRRFYPLLHNAYADLGEKKTFHGVMLTAIDKLLATPEPATEPELIPAEKGLYKFASPTLEALPAAQKPLIRMGRENARELKAWLRRVKAAVLHPPEPDPVNSPTPSPI